MELVVARGLMEEAEAALLLLLEEAMAMVDVLRVVNCQSVTYQNRLLHLVALVHLVHLVHLVAPAVLVALADGLGHLDHLQVCHVHSIWQMLRLTRQIDRCLS